MPRNVIAATSPSARGREPPVNRCDAAAVATGISAPPPTAWTRRAAIRSSSDGAAPARSDPIVNTTIAHRNSRRAPYRSASRPATGIVTM